MSLFSYEEEMNWIKEKAAKALPSEKQKWETAKQVLWEVNEIAMAIENLSKNK